MAFDTNRQYLTTEELADRLRRSPGTIANWRSKGQGPRFLRPSGGKRGRILYRLEDIDEWERSSLLSRASEDQDDGES